jgi:diacylglycerol diphosphate phosphatase / phosphatidate phosphatase
MRLFNRRSPGAVTDPNVLAATTTDSPTHSRRSRHSRRGTRSEKTHRPLFDRESGYYNRRPAFGQWIKMTWLDIVTMAIMGIIGLGVYEANPAPSRSFPIDFRDGEVVYPEFAYPLRNEIVPIWLAALLGSLIPIAVILFMQIRVRSFWDVNNAVIGLLYSLITAAVFQVFLKARSLLRV